MQRDANTYHFQPGDFTPRAALKNGHVQTVLTGIKLRRPLVRHRAKAFLQHVDPCIIDCGEGVRLRGFFSGHANPADSIVILIHGWAGDADSSYLISTAAFLWQQGHDIFRLNLRDHGDTHHLNRGLFHSCRIDEVVGAVRRIQQTFPRKKTFLAGFSLGGSFALRTAVLAPDAGIHLDHAAAVCPVLNPSSTLMAIENGWWLYHWYYLKKWQRSLAVKRSCFPDIEGLSDAARFTSLWQMTDYFVGRFTRYPTMTDYLDGYTITPQYLTPLTVPTLIMAAADDPVIPISDFDPLCANDMLRVEIYPHGGHCGFFNDLRLNSVVELRLADLFGNGQ